MNKIYNNTYNKSSNFSKYSDLEQCLIVGLPLYPKNYYNKKQIIKLINTRLYNDNSKTYENYDLKYNSKNKIISFKMNDELLYRFNFKRNGLIRKQLMYLRS